MRENRTYGSEGGGIELNRASLPLSLRRDLRPRDFFTACGESQPMVIFDVDRLVHRVLLESHPFDNSRFNGDPH